MEAEKQLGATRDGFLLMKSSYDSLLKIMRKEVNVPKWLLDVCDESKNMNQGFLYLMLELEKKKKAVCPVAQYANWVLFFATFAMLA